MSPHRPEVTNTSPEFFAAVVAFTALLLLPIWPSFAGEAPGNPLPLVITALEELDANDLDEQWHFTMSLLQEDELQLIRSDPLQGKYERRKLLSVDGQTPDKERLEEFRTEEVKRINGIDPEARGYSHLVDSSTLRLITQKGELSEFSFVPRIKALEDAEGKMQGTLSLNTNSNAIEKIEVRNTLELSPAFSVSVDSYRLTFMFQPEQGARLLHKMESHAVGKVGFLKSFDQLVVVNFGDFRRAADTASLP